MANESSIGYGLRPIGKTGQNADNQGLSEYSIAASPSAAINQNDIVQPLATGTIGLATSTATQILGSFNGAFFTDSSTQKPTYANHVASGNAATDIVGFVADDPYERFEIRSAGTVATTSVFLSGDISYVAADSANFVSRTKLSATLITDATSQLTIIGFSKREGDGDPAAVNPSVVVTINEHYYIGSRNAL
jgi:hypothetical protein